MGDVSPLYLEKGNTTDLKQEWYTQHMRILIVHNFYKNPGGEDVVFEAETELLINNGHEVEQFIANNKDIEQMPRAKLAMNMIWSKDTNRDIQQKIIEFQPDIVHFHNTFMMISPSVYYICRKMGVPVVQTLHNYRLICPNATFYRDNQVCTLCLGKAFASPGVRHGCYRDSHTQSAGVAAMLSFHRMRQTWNQQVDTYISLTNFAKAKFIEAGFPEEKIAVKPNFLKDDPEVSQCDGRYMLYMGRLTPEKGLRLLLQAWKELAEANMNIPLKIIGKGPLDEELQQFVEDNGLYNVEILGHKHRNEALQILKGATALVFPSQWYETFGLVNIEAYATGKPVIAAGFGTMLEVIENGKTGLHFAPNDPQDLADKVRCLWEEPALTHQLGEQARKIYEQKYTPKANYARLIEIYEETKSRFNSYHAAHT